MAIVSAVSPQCQFPPKPRPSGARQRIRGFNRARLASKAMPRCRKARGQFPNNVAGWPYLQAEGLRKRSMGIPAQAGLIYSLPMRQGGLCLIQEVLGD